MGTASGQQALYRRAILRTSTQEPEESRKVNGTGVDTFRFFENANCRLSG
jgi:hypothetical protein